MNFLSNKNILIILASVLVVVMGLWAMMTIRARRVSPQKTYESQIEKLEKQSVSDDLTDIEKDVNETDLQNIDKELQDIEKEFKGL